MVYLPDWARISKPHCQPATDCNCDCRKATVSDEDMKRICARYLFHLNQGSIHSGLIDLDLGSWLLTLDSRFLLAGLVDASAAELDIASAGFPQWSLAWSCDIVSLCDLVRICTRSVTTCLRCTGRVTGRCLSDLARMLLEHSFREDLWKKLPGSSSHVQCQPEREPQLNSSQGFATSMCLHQSVWHLSWHIHLHAGPLWQVRFGKRFGFQTQCWVETPTQTVDRWLFLWCRRCRCLVSLALAYPERTAEIFQPWRSTAHIGSTYLA